MAPVQKVSLLDSAEGQLASRLLDMYVPTTQRHTVASDKGGPICWLTRVGEFQCLCDVAGSGGGKSFLVGV